MLIVHKFAPAWGLPDISPFVVKLETYLRFAGIPYEAKAGDPRKAPKGKIPFVEDDGITLGDTRFIIEHLEAKRGIFLDARLTPKERGLAAAFQAMMEEQLYFVLVYERWQLDANWRRHQLPTMKGIFSGMGIPGPMSGVVSALARKQMLKALHFQGTGRHAPAEVAQIGERIVGALAEYLDGDAFFFGAEPAIVDATAYAFLQGVLDSPFDGPLRQAATRAPRLRAYVDRVKARYWPA